MDREKKIKAALSAVMTYLKSEEEAVCQQAAMADREQLPRPNHWGGGGRQSMMQVRNMMQLKAFHSFRR